MINDLKLLSEIKRIARELSTINRRVTAIERAPQLKRSSFVGTQHVYDEDDTVRQVIGLQEDGSYTVSDVNAPIPPTPTPPVITAQVGTLTISWVGSNVEDVEWPADFKYVEVHVSPTADFEPTDVTQVTTFNSLKGGSAVVALDVAPYFVKLVAVNTSGVESEPSLERSETPLAPEPAEPPPLTDGDPPSAATTVTPIGGLGAMYYRWNEVPNNDPVTYRLHVRAGSAPTIDGTYEVAAGVGLTSATVRKLKDGTTIVSDGSVTYHAIVTVEDADDLGPASADATGVPAQVNTRDILATAIDGMTITGALIQTAPTGTRVWLDTAGLHAHNGVEETVTIDSATGALTVKSAAAAVITGATFQTRAEEARGIKMGRVEGDTNYDEALIVFNEAGEAFLKAVPAEGLAMIDGEVKPNSLSVTPKTPEDGTSLAGITEITRHPDGSSGALVLTGFTTPPKSAPTVTPGYDTVQFTDDGLWANRNGWTTDGTSWYTVRQNTDTNGKLEKWNGAGALVSSSSTFSMKESGGVACSATNAYTLAKESDGTWYLSKWSLSAPLTDGSTDATSALGLDASSTRTPTVGIDPNTGEVLIAQTRTPDDFVRIRRFNPTTLNMSATIVDTDAYDGDLAGVTYTSYDMGIGDYYYLSKRGAQDLWGVGSTGTGLGADFQFPSGMSTKVGFTYARRTAAVTLNSTTTVTAASGTFVKTDVGSAISGTGFPVGAWIAAYVSSTQVTISSAATSSGAQVATIAAFKSMDTAGKMRTYTGEGKALAPGHANLTKWVSNTLANATLQTTQSPRAKIVMPKRSKLNVTTSKINTGGTNAPDRVFIYVGQGTADPTNTGMIRQTDPTVGANTKSYSSIATSPVTNPPTINGFETTGGGTVQQIRLADGTVLIDGISAGILGEWKTDWSAATVTWTGATTNPVLGADGAILGRYRKVGKVVDFFIQITMGAATTYGTGGWRIDLPITEAGRRFVFNGVALDTSAGTHFDITGIRTAVDTVRIFCDPATAGAAMRDVTATVPFTWASGDQLHISGTYESSA